MGVTSHCTIQDGHETCVNMEATLLPCVTSQEDQKISGSGLWIIKNMIQPCVQLTDARKHYVHLSKHV